jgi:hypothetical protein
MFAHCWKHYWPPMNAGERGFKDGETFVSDLRLSAFIGGQLFRNY